jgi:hypothetical protein
MLIAASLVLAACQPMPATQVTPPDKEWTSENLMSIIEAASRLEPVESKNSTEVVEDREEGGYRYVQEKHNVIKNRESVLYLGLNDDVLFPGALIQGKDAADFVYPPIIAARTPITLSLSLEGVPSAGESIMLTVDDPSRLSNVRQGMSNLLKTAIKADTKVPAKFDYSSEQVYSSEEKNLALGVSGSYADVSMNYDFNWKSSSKKNKILSTYKQVYYTVDVDLPSKPYTWFDPDAGVEGVQEALPPGSMPMYVSSVSYGWMGVVFIETDFSKDEMDMALGVAYDPAGDMNAKMDFGYSTKEVLQSSKIQIIVYGGSSAGITRGTLSGYSGLVELIEGSKDFGAASPGVPLSFKLRHLSNNLTARIALTEEYTITKAVKTKEFVRISVDEFECTYEDDDSPSSEMDRFNFRVMVYSGSRLILDRPILAWATKGTHDMVTGDRWSPDKAASTVAMLDLREMDLAAYSVVLSASAREYDPSPLDPEEWASASKTVHGSQLYDPANLFFTITNPGDITFNVHYTIAATTAAECQAYDECKALIAEAEPQID